MAQGSITTTTWGTVDGQEVKKFTLRNKVGQEVDIVTYGATVTAVRTPDKDGIIADVVLGFDNIEGIFVKGILLIASYLHTYMHTYEEIS